jgi:hypothetical protein
LYLPFFFHRVGPLYFNEADYLVDISAKYLYLLIDTLDGLNAFFEAIGFALGKLSESFLEGIDLYVDVVVATFFLGC